MGNNNLYTIEKSLRSIAKKYRGIKYSLGLAILFLMMGLSAFSEEVMSTQEIAASKENIRSSVETLQNKVEAARKENSKEINGLRLELIQNKWIKIRINSIDGTRKSSSKITLVILAIWS